jgi:hypothetical protein
VITRLCIAGSIYARKMANTGPAMKDTIEHIKNEARNAREKRVAGAKPSRLIRVVKKRRLAPLGTQD